MPRKNKPGAGRPRVFATELPVYDSMEQASGATGIPIAAFKHAKKNGCLFFRHGRVNLSEFIHWFFNRPDKEEGDERSEDWTYRDKRAAAMLKEINVDERMERVVDFDLVERFLRKLVGSDFFGELERMRQDFPPQLKGKSELDIAEHIAKSIGRTKESIAKSMENWVKSKGKQ